MEYLIQDDAQRPHIHRIRVVMKLGLFWRDVLLGARDGFHDDLLRAESEVSQLNQGKWFPCDILGLEQYVFRFEIAMRNPVVVQFLHSLTDLQNALQTLPFVHLVVLAEVERVPMSASLYQSDPPEQYSVIYHTISGCSMISKMRRMFSF